MDITWYGHSCFRLKNRTTTIITDPYDKSLGLPMPRLKGDIVTVSHDTAHHNHVEAVKSDFKLINAPGEYEIGGVFITGIYLPRNGTTTPTDKNHLFVIRIDDVSVCHLGDLNQIPTQSQVENLGNIDVLLVPVGGNNALNAGQASEIISLIEPLLVVPMHFHLPDMAITLDPLDKFLKEMGINQLNAEDMLRVTKSSLPDETRIVLLNAKV